MATIATLAVAITAKTTKFEKGIKRVQRTVNKVGRDMAGLGAKITAPFVAATVVFAQYGDSIAKAARRTGIAVDSLSRLGYMADISGASMQTVEKGIKRMSAALVDARDGLQESLRPLEMLNLNAEELLQMSPEQAFMKIGAALGAMENPLEKAAAAQDLFGRAGMDLLPLFDLGEQGMAKLAQRAEDLGIVLGKTAAEDAEKLTDAFTDLKAGMVGMAITLVRNLGIPFDQLSDRIVKIVKDVRGWISRNGEIIKGVLKLGAVLLGLGTGLIVLGQLLGSVTAITGAFALMNPATAAIALTLAAVAAGAWAVAKAFDGIYESAEKGLGAARNAAQEKLLEQIRALESERDSVLKRVGTKAGVGAAGKLVGATKGIPGVGGLAGGVETLAGWFAGDGQAEMDKSADELAALNMRIEGLRKSYERQTKLVDEQNKVIPAAEPAAAAPTGPGKGSYEAFKQAARLADAQRKLSDSYEKRLQDETKKSSMFGGKGVLQLGKGLLDAVKNSDFGRAVAKEISTVTAAIATGTPRGGAAAPGSTQLAYAGAAEYGSVAAYSASLPTMKPAVETAKNTKESVKQQEKTNRYLETIASGSTEVVTL